MYKVNNWLELQHYKDRNPPWVKLHKKLLDNFQYQCLPIASKALAPMLWLLASEHIDPKSGIIDKSDEEICFRVRITSKEFNDGIKPLIKSGFIILMQDADILLAKRLHDATPETETYREETEAETKKEIDKPIKFKPEDVSDQVWVDFLSHRKAKKAPITETAIKGIRKESDKAGIGLQEALEITMARGWQSFKSEWLTKGDNYGSGQNSNREIIIGTGDIAGKPKGDGYGGRKSQTELYAEATDRIIAKRNAEWAEKEFAERIKGPPKPAIEAPTTDLFSTEEIR